MVAGKLEDSSQEIADREEQKHCSAGLRDRSPLRAGDQPTRQAPHIPGQIAQLPSPLCALVVNALPKHVPATPPKAKSPVPDERSGIPPENPRSNPPPPNGQKDFPQAHACQRKPTPHPKPPDFGKQPSYDKKLNPRLPTINFFHSHY
jgi:hypothetical protein